MKWNAEYNSKHQQSKTDAQTNNQASKNNIHFNIDTIST